MIPYFPVLILFIQYLFYFPPVEKLSNDRIPGYDYPYTEVVQVQKDGNEEGYSYYYPATADLEQAPVILFIHGYGAINPMIFGAWIEHLVLQGNIVIYPRYQRNLLLPSSDRFTPLVAGAFSDAMKELTSIAGAGLRGDLFIVGHSYGGVIAANLGVQHDSFGIKRPRAIFTCEPGHGPLTGGVLGSYSDFSDSVPLVVMVGDKDWTVGDEFGKRLFHEIPDQTPKLLLRQCETSYDSLYISASHYEPYSVDPEFDNGNRNLTFKRAMKKGKLDAVDFYGYWKILDDLILCDDGSGVLCLDQLKEGWTMGNWPGTCEPVESIRVEAFEAIRSTP